VEVDARHSRPSRVMKAFLLDHMCAGSWCQQTARAFPCGQWHASCVTGSLCAFATRMETGLFKQRTCVICDSRVQSMQKDRILRTKTVPSIKCLASSVQSMPPCQIVVAWSTTRADTNLDSFAYMLFQYLFGEVTDHVAKSPKCGTFSQTCCSQSYCHSVVTRRGKSARTYCFDHLVALRRLSPGGNNGSWATTPRPVALGYVSCT